jgi:diguanylate cyclase (GGDEF)-like protein
MLSTVIESASIVVICLLFGVALLVAWWDFERDLHVALWALSFMAAALGHGFRISGGVWKSSQEFLAMLACHASVAGFALMAWGFRRRAQKGAGLVWMVWAASSLLLACAWAIHGVDWRTDSRVITAGADAALVAFIVATLARARGTGRIARWILALYGLYAASVGVAAWLARPGGEISNEAFIAVLSIGTPTGMIGTGILTLLIVSADLERNLRNQARTDALTGLLNRRGAEDRIALLLEQASEARPLAVVIADIDRFKSVNDRLGHVTGDEVLRRFATHLRTSVRRGDIAARLGGEEFVLLLPDTKADDAVSLTERIRTTVPRAFEDRPELGGISVSFGVALASGSEAFARTLARADAALYQSKSDGRDCVTLAAPAEPMPGPDTAGSGEFELI